MYHIRWKNPSQYKGWLRFLFFPTDENEDQAYAKFMRAHKCYDLIPTSAKLVIFDTKLNVSISEVCKKRGAPRTLSNSNEYDQEMRQSKTVDQHTAP